MKPWQKRPWSLPPKADGAFVCAMEDVLGVYHRPYDPKRPQICMDEASKQLLGEVREPLPPKPGTPARQDSQYQRCGTASIFLWVEPLTGRTRVEVSSRRTRIDWARQIKKLVDEDYPQAEKIVLVLDNLNIHAGASLYEAFEPAEAQRLYDKLEIHYTPKHASWLNMAEIELSVLSRQCLDRRIGDYETLVREVAAWQQEHNANQSPVNWRFQTADARIKLKSLYPSI